MLPTRLLLAFTLLLVVAQATQVQAGGGPENVLVVVNQNSDASKTIANYYIRQRNIPPCCVVYVDWKGAPTIAPGWRFREQILKPVLETMEERHLAGQIEYVVYSADFPYTIDFTEEFKEEKLPKQFRPLASINGATYLWVYVLNKSPAMTMPTVNWYVPPEARKNQTSCVDCSQVETRGFRARTFWSKDGEQSADPKKGQAYFLSTMLGVTVKGGNTVDEVVSDLTRSSTVNGSHPTGTFYFMKNGNIRSKARHNCYQAVCDQLQAEGAKAEVLDGRGPPATQAALGIMLGTARFSFDASETSLVPGAICDHFTSFGGKFNQTGQTTLAEWIRAGAAGTSGTVTEPFAIQAKFPLPSMHLHYWRGASLGEAFYQSICGPYQLLVVGDPLCQPFARPPEVELVDIQPGQQLAGVVEIKSKVTPQPGTTAGLAELYFDGRLLARYPHQLPVPLKTADIPPGHHELRLVVSTTDSIGFRGRAIVPVVVGDPQAASEVKIEVAPNPVVAAGQQVRVTVSGPADAKGIEILQNQRRVGFVKGSSGSVELDSKLLGRGPVGLVAQLAGTEDSPEAGVDSGSRSKTSWVMIR